MEESMNKVGFSEEEKANIFKVVAAVLHIGNIAFEESQDKDGKIHLHLSKTWSACLTRKVHEMHWMQSLLPWLQGWALTDSLWPLVPNFFPWATRKSYFFDTNRMLGTLDFTFSEHWALPSIFFSTALKFQAHVVLLLEYFLKPSRLRFLITWNQIHMQNNVPFWFYIFWCESCIVGPQVVTL